MQQKNNEKKNQAPTLNLAWKTQDNLRRTIDYYVKKDNTIKGTQLLLGNTQHQPTKHVYLLEVKQSSNLFTDIAKLILTEFQLIEYRL